MATHSGILARKSHGQRGLEGYSPWGRKESDTTERLNDNEHLSRLDISHLKSSHKVNYHHFF